MPPNPPEEVIDLAVEQYSEELLKRIVQKILDEYPAIYVNLVVTQITSKHIPIDSSRRAEHEYANEKLRNHCNKKVVGLQSCGTCSTCATY
jgi:hypothetical protein